MEIGYALSAEEHAPLSLIEHAVRAEAAGIIRMHPAIVAHAAGTAAALMPGRFFLGVGTGENLNEHVLGDQLGSLPRRPRLLGEDHPELAIGVPGGRDDGRLHDLPPSARVAGVQACRGSSRRDRVVGLRLRGDVSFGRPPSGYA